MALADHQDLVDKLVRDDTGKIATGDRDVAIGLAVERYSKDRPRILVEDLTSAGGNTLDLPEAWQDGFSVVRSLEYPVGQFPPVFIERHTLYQNPDAIVILIDTSLAASAIVRANFTARHQLDDEADTIPESDREPLASYGAAILLDQLAALYSGDSNSSISADVVDHQNKGELYASRARNLRRIYFDHLGIDPKRAVPAGTVVSFEGEASDRRGRLTHPLRQR